MLKKLGKYAGSVMLLALAFGQSAVAQNAVKMTQSNSQESIFLLSDTPVVTFEDKAIVVETNSEKVTCELQGGVVFEFVNYEFNDTPSSVEGVESAVPVFKVNSSAIEAYNLTPGSPVMIADLSGKTLYSSSADNNGHVYVSVADYPAGVYVFTSKDKNFKFYKK